MAGADAALVYGLHAVRALLARRPQALGELRVETGAHADCRAAAVAAGVPVAEVSRSVLDRLSGGAVHQGVLGVLRPAAPLREAALEQLLAERVQPLLLVLDGVQDPRNLGACLRSADAAGVDAVIVPQRRAVGLTASVRKAACGAAEWVPLVVAGNLARALRTLRAAGVRVVGAQADAPQRLPDVDLTGPLALVLGGEGQGLRALTRTLCDALVSIPMRGAAGSLNVSVAAGICLYAATCQRSR